METAEDKEAVVAFTVRLPYKIHKDLRRITVEHDSSINGLIGYLVSEYLEEHHNGCPACG